MSRQENPVLRRRDSGSQVVMMQGLLRDAGWNIRADGVFGPRTETALRQYQDSLVSRGLLAADQVVPGVFDDATRMAALVDAWRREAARQPLVPAMHPSLDEKLSLAMGLQPSSPPTSTRPSKEERNRG